MRVPKDFSIKRGQYQTTLTLLQAVVCRLRGRIQNYIEELRDTEVVPRTFRILDVSNVDTDDRSRAIAIGLDARPAPFSPLRYRPTRRPRAIRAGSTSPVQRAGSKSPVHSRDHSTSEQHSSRAVVLQAVH